MNPIILNKELPASGNLSPQEEASVSLPVTGVQLQNEEQASSKK